MSKQKQIKKTTVSNKETQKIVTPTYVLEGNLNIPESLKTVKDYFRDCGNKNYQVCLVGKRESVAKDLKERGYQGKEFIHLDTPSLKTLFPFFPVRVNNSIIRTNRLISNPRNDFNKTPAGSHTLGLVPISEIQTLNDLGYGTTFWNSVGVFASQELLCLAQDEQLIAELGNLCNEDPDIVVDNAEETLEKAPTVEDPSGGN